MFSRARLYGTGGVGSCDAGGRGVEVVEAFLGYAGADFRGQAAYWRVLVHHHDAVSLADGLQHVIVVYWRDAEQVHHLGVDAFLRQFLGGVVGGPGHLDRPTRVTSVPSRTVRALPMG